MYQVDSSRILRSRTFGLTSECRLMQVLLFSDTKGSWILLMDSIDAMDYLLMSNYSPHSSAAARGHHHWLGGSRSARSPRWVCRPVAAWHGRWRSPRAVLCCWATAPSPRPSMGCGVCGVVEAVGWGRCCDVRERTGSLSVVGVGTLKTQRKDLLLFHTELPVIPLYSS